MTGRLKQSVRSYDANLFDRHDGKSKKVFFLPVLCKISFPFYIWFKGFIIFLWLADRFMPILSYLSLLYDHFL